MLYIQIKKEKNQKGTCKKKRKKKTPKNKNRITTNEWITYIIIFFIEIKNKIKNQMTSQDPSTPPRQQNVE